MEYAEWIESKNSWQKECSNCNFHIVSYLAQIYSYCPHCGRYMRKSPNKCSCYYESIEFHYINNYRKIQRVVGRCNGTKEREICACGGDENKCDFYSDKRRK